MLQRRIVPETERDLADCVGAIYEAATGSGSWQLVGERLRRLMNARRATLRISDGTSPSRNVLMAVDESETVYAAYYRLINPYSVQAQRDFTDNRANHMERAMIGAELVAEDAFLRSEYYVDFARRYERRHMIGGMVGISEPTPVSLFRADDGEPFGPNEMRRLQMLLPHVQRALELRERLGRQEQVTWMTRATLDSLPVGVAIVDAGLKLHFLNDAGRQCLGQTGSGLRSMRSGPYSGSGVYLAATSRQEATGLRRLVASATSGGPGGAMRVSGIDRAAWAILVSPAPRALANDQGGNDRGGLAESLAIVVIRQLGRAAAPSAGMLCDVYGFSRAEAEVAAALSGGASAEDVAQFRNVSLTTVRSQIRSILGKSECENLRDLESSMASLAALTPRSRTDDH